MPCLPMHPGAHLACVTAALRAAVWGAPFLTPSRLLHAVQLFNLARALLDPTHFALQTRLFLSFPVCRSPLCKSLAVWCAKQGTRACKAFGAEQDCCAPAHMEEDPLFNSPDTKIRYEAYRHAASTCLSGTSVTSAKRRARVSKRLCACAAGCRRPAPRSAKSCPSPR